MKDQIYSFDFGVNYEREGFAVTRPDADRVTYASEDGMVTRSLQTTGDIVYALLMITIVGAHPLWVMLLLVLVYSR